MVKKTGFKINTKLTRGKKIHFSNADLDKDGKPNKIDCNPYDQNKQDFGGLGSPQPKPRTYRGYNVDDYYFSGGKWHLSPQAEPVDKKGLFSRLFK